MGIASFIGGAAGGLLLLAAGDARFSALIPWLLAFATGLFAFSPQLSSALRRMRPAPAKKAGDAHGAGSPIGWLVQLLVSVYGGFFGAGMGILMMASLAIGGHEDVQHINALKNLLSAVIYSVTVMTFIVAGAVSWPHTAGDGADRQPGRLLGRPHGAQNPGSVAAPHGDCRGQRIDGLLFFQDARLTPPA